MRSPMDSLRLDCGVNRLSVSHDERGILAVPLDNRHIKLYDLTGNRLANLPRRNRQVISLAAGHTRLSMKHVSQLIWPKMSKTNNTGPLIKDTPKEDQFV